MGVEINNPFGGGLAAYNMAANGFSNNNIGNSIQRLAQANALERIAPIVEQTNMYNMNKMLPKLNAEGLRLSPQAMAQLQASNQQLAYDKINTANIAKLFMNTGKTVGGSVSGGISSKGANALYANVKQPWINEDTFNQDVQAGSTASPEALALAEQSKRRNAMQKLLAVQALKGKGTFNPSIGDLYPQQRNAAADQLARLAYLDQGNSAPKQLFNAPNTRHTQQNITTKQNIPVNKNVAPTKPIVQEQPTTVQTAEQPIVTTAGTNSEPYQSTVDTTIDDNNMVKKIYGIDADAANARREIEQLTPADNESIQKPMEMLSSRIADIQNSNLPDEQKQAAIQPLLNNIERLTKTPGEFKSAVERIKEQTAADQQSTIDVNANSNSYTSMQDRNAQYKALEDLKNHDDIVSANAKEKVAQLEGDYKIYSNLAAEYDKDYLMTKNPKFKTQGDAFKLRAIEAQKNIVGITNKFNKAKAISDKNQKGMSDQIVKPSIFNNGNATIKSIVGEDVINKLDSHTGFGGLDSIVKDMDNMTTVKNRADGKTAYQVGNGVYFVGKDAADIKAKFASLLKAAASPSNKTNIYDTYMNSLYNKAHDEQASKAERENAMRTYEWFIDNINDQQGHRKRATERGETSGFTRPWKQMYDSMLRE